ncbi:MAG: NUDIX domain-containing protein [Chloroflexota bacterium]
MVSLGTNVAVFANGEVLLTRREDFEVWCMPGGHVDPGESFAQCGIREVFEETGLHVRLTQFVGTYSRMNWHNGLYHVQLFTAEVVGGALKPQQGEVIDIRYFPISDLPDAMLIGQRHRIMDAAQNLTGVVKTESVTWPFDVVERAAVYALRDKSDLARADFYTKHFPPLRPDQITVELPGT